MSNLDPVCPTCGRPMPSTPIGKALAADGRSLRAIAKAAGVGHSTVYRWAAGRDISLSNARAIAKTLHKSLDNLADEDAEL